MQALTPEVESTLQNGVLRSSEMTSPLGSRPRSASLQPERLLPPSQTLHGQVAVCCPIGGPSGVRTNILLGPTSQFPHLPACTHQRLPGCPERWWQPQLCTGGCWVLSSWTSERMSFRQLSQAAPLPTCLLPERPTTSSFPVCFPHSGGPCLVALFPGATSFSFCPPSRFCPWVSVLGESHGSDSELKEVCCEDSRLSLEKDRGELSRRRGASVSPPWESPKAQDRCGLSSRSSSNSPLTFTR